MKPELDFGHFYKFLTSAGVLLLAASVSVQWIVLRESDVLLVEESHLKQLTPTARAAILRSQRQLRWLGYNGWWISSVLALGSLGLISFGMIRWSRRQKVQDRIEDEDLRKRLEPMTLGDVERKVERDVEELAAEAASVSQAPAVPPTASTAPDGQRERLRNKVVAIEAQILDLLERAVGDKFELERNLSVEIDGQRFEVDAALYPQIDNLSYGRVLLLEVKVLPLIQGAKREPRLREAATQLTRVTHLLDEAHAGAVGGYDPVLIVVCSSAASDADLFDAAGVLAAAMNDLRGMGWLAVVTRENSLVDMVPSEIRSALVLGGAFVYSGLEWVRHFAAS